MPATVTIELVARLKVEAAAMSQKTKRQRSSCLNDLARREGFSSWPILMSKIGRGADVKRQIRSLGLPTPNKPTGSAE